VKDRVLLGVSFCEPNSTGLNTLNSTKALRNCISQNVSRVGNQTEVATHVELSGGVRRLGKFMLRKLNLF
jgi:hypothetical protein